MPQRLLTGTFVALATATLVFYIASGIVVTAAPLFGSIELGLSKALVGIAIAVFSVAALAARPLVGWVSDRYGRRVSLLVGGALMVGGLLGHLLATDLVSFIVVRSVLGIGEGFWLVAALAAAADLAPEGRRGESLSFLSLSLYLGLAIGPGLAEWILGATGSFPAVWLVTAAVAAVGLGLAWLVPETAPRLVAARGDATAGAPAGPAAAPRPRLIHPAGLFPGFVILLALSGMAYYLTFVALYVRTIGVDGAGAALAEYGLIVVALRALGARLPDRLGAATLSGSALATTAVGLAILGLIPSPLGLYLGTGLFAAGIAFVMPALISLAVSRAPVEERGTVVGTATLFIDVSFGIAPVVLGAVAEAAGYAAGFGVAAAISALGCLLLVGGSRRGMVAAPVASIEG